MIKGMKLEEQRIDPTVGLPRDGVGVLARTVRGSPRPAPGQQVPFQGSDDLGGDLFTDLAGVGHREPPLVLGSCLISRDQYRRGRNGGRHSPLGSPHRSVPSPPFVHDGRGPLMNFQVVAATFKFLEKVGEFVGLGGAAVGDTEAEISGAMLPNVLVGRAELALVVGGQLGEKGKDHALSIRSEDHDCRIHWLGPF